MLTLFKTLLGIIQFRLGPDAIPRSSVVFAVVIIWWLAADLVGLVLNFEGGMRQILISLLVSIPGLLIYSALLQANGKGDRVLQMLSAVIGCAALFGFVLSLIFAFVMQLPNEGQFPILALLAVWIIVLWSVAVDGHILARSLNFPRAFGTAVALSVFVFQYYLSALFSAGSPPAS